MCSIRTLYFSLLITKFPTHLFSKQILLAMHSQQILLLLVVLVLRASARAPKAWCYDDNKKVPGVRPVPSYKWNKGLNDPNNVSQGPNGLETLCNESALHNSSVRTPDGYSISMDASHGDASGGFTCSDVGGDARNLASQCPFGGVLQHWAPSNGQSGNVRLAHDGSPNTPREPDSWK